MHKALFVFAFSLVLCGQSPADPAKKDRAAVIGPDDTIMISAMNADEISKAWRVSAAGDVNLPMVGRMQVAGMTVEQFEQLLTKRMRKFYVDPQVTAYISEFRSQPITVTGPVEKPGTYQLQGYKTLFDVMVMTGGPKENAGATLTLTRAKESGKIEYPGVREDESRRHYTLELQVKEVMDGRSKAASIPVETNDVIAVTEFKQQKTVAIAGEVMKPGAVELVTQDTVSLLKVLALAGGLSRTASAGRTMIVHLNDKGMQTSTAYVDLKRILAGRAKDIDLTAGDIIIVPSNTLMTYLQTASLSAVTTGVYILGRF